MNISRIRQFVAVAETGSLRKAADVVGCSAAAVSKGLAKLQEEVGMQLVVPDGRGVRLTHDGEEFAVRAARLLEEVERFEAGIAEPEAGQSMVRIASFEIFTTYFLGELLAVRLPGTDAAIASAVPGEVERAVADSRADIGITYAPVPTAGVDHRLVCSVDFDVFVRAGSPLLRVERGRMPFVVPAKLAAGITSRNRTADGWPANVARTISHRVNAMESALELCRRGIAASYLPRFVVDLHNEQVKPEYELVAVSGFPREVRSRHQVYVATRASQPDDRIVHQVITALGRLGATAV